jgi:hypothetical protein
MHRVVSQQQAVFPATALMQYCQKATVG